MISPSRFFIVFSCFFLLSLIPIRAVTGPRIILYAAHGGADKGVSADGEVEKDWTLRLGIALQKVLAADGFDVVMIRTKDESLANDAWVNQANASGAAAAVILHADREWTGRVKGPWVIVEPPTGFGSPDSQMIQRWGTMPYSQFRQSLHLAKILTQAWGVNSKLSSLSDGRALPGEIPSPDGRILASPHQSLRDLVIPAVVVEPLFLTSEQDIKIFSTDQGIQDFATKTASGIQTYFQMPPPATSSEVRPK
jgi:N-acetylmuramoyl-L-alanine amidase